LNKKNHYAGQNSHNIETRKKTFKEKLIKFELFE
jgi:hypothetical protein